MLRFEVLAITLLLIFALAYVWSDILPHLLPASLLEQFLR